MNRCNYLTKTNQQCARDLHQGLLYCWQHSSRPQHLLGGLAIDMVDLAEHKTLPYDQFIEAIIDHSNEIAFEEEDKVICDYFNHQICMGKKITININSSSFGIWDDLNPGKITLYNQNGWTNGQLLYQLAQQLGDYDSAEETYGNHAHFEGLMMTNDGSYNIDC